MKNILIFILLFTLVSCGARKKAINKQKDIEKIEVSVKKDSTVIEKTKTDSVAVIKYDKEDFEVYVEPITEDKTINDKTVIVETPSGKKTKVTYPSNSKLILKSSKDKTEQKTELKKTDEKNIEVKTDSTFIKETDSSFIKKDVSVSEPKSFNRTIAWVIGIITLIVIGIGILKYKKII